jgi:hypothetical protein
MVEKSSELELLYASESLGNSRKKKKRISNNKQGWKKHDPNTSRMSTNRTIKECANTS